MVASGAHIAVRDLTMAFGDFVLMHDLTFDVAHGDVFVIMGGSGSGKSTLLRHMIGLLEPARGDVLYDGESFTHADPAAREEMRRRFGVLYQSGALWSSMTLAENVALPLRKHGKLSPRAALEDARARLAQVQMAEHADRYPAELSDGMRKRAAIARTLALSPEVVLFDEPTTGLDPVSARRIDRLIRELADGLGVTAIVVSHDLASIFGVADRVAFLYQGVVHVVATPAALRASPDPIVQQFVNGRSSGPMETPGF
jgi:phospholipid/cholesterol/gamma-HCH transport system ATP-binding protein